MTAVLFFPTKSAITDSFFSISSFKTSLKECALIIKYWSKVFFTWNSFFLIRTRNRRNWCRKTGKRIGIKWSWGGTCWRIWWFKRRFTRLFYWWTRVTRWWWLWCWWRTCKDFCQRYWINETFVRKSKRLIIEKWQFLKSDFEKISDFCDIFFIVKKKFLGCLFVQILWHIFHCKEKIIRVSGCTNFVTYFSL